MVPIASPEQEASSSKIWSREESQSHLWLPASEGLFVSACYAHLAMLSFILLFAFCQFVRLEPIGRPG